MIQASSNMTLALKIGISTFLLTFLAILNISVQYSKSDMGLKMVAIALFAAFATLIYFFLLPLKRVEMDGEFLYVTNYFKTFRYPYHNIEKVVEKKVLGFQVVEVTFKTVGNFGKSIVFVPSRLYKNFKESNPSFRELVA